MQQWLYQSLVEWIISFHVSCRALFLINTELYYSVLKCSSTVDSYSVCDPTYPVVSFPAFPFQYCIFEFFFYCRTLNFIKFHLSDFIPLSPLIYHAYFGSSLSNAFSLLHFSLPKFQDYFPFHQVINDSNCSEAFSSIIQFENETLAFTFFHTVVYLNYSNNIQIMFHQLAQ